MLRRTKKGNTSFQEHDTSLLLDQCLAKTWKQADGRVLKGRDVYSHCLIVGQVGQVLVEKMPAWLREAFFPSGSALVVACHDDGKVSPTFQRKIYSNLTQTPIEIWSVIQDATLDENKLWGGHAGVSQVTLEAIKAGKCIPEIAGQHHGWSPNIGARQARSEVFGGETWLAQRIILIEDLKQALNQDFPVIESDLQAKVIAGLTTVADWIGSGSLFDNPMEDWHPKIQQAIEDAGFIQPKIQSQLTFEEIFGFLPREAQSQLFELASQPGVYVLEAPMGLGKTEAALYAAYRLLEQGKATGLYFALPTQLTSEKIHERVSQFLQAILEKNSFHASPILLHGQAWLKQQMGEDAAPGGEWFSQGKKGILAPFAVGTIDQALMAVLHVKHGFVRTFGLAGKVVILDEVHTYDAYTGTVMDELVAALRKLHCTVIILSATLTQERRQALLKTPVEEEAYPLISGLSNNTLKEIAIEPTEKKMVAIKIESNSDVAIEEALTRAEQGQQILWIENTVAQAQERFLTLSARASGLGIETGLLHSRFTQTHRQINEEKWVTLFGKAGWPQRKQTGRILVGTQVLEQSLDIDADILITRLAPTDMILQRLGRLWRHENPHRHSNAKQEAWIIAPDLQAAIENPDKHFGNSAKVYSPYVLCRTLEVWQTQDQVGLPHDIRALIEATYQKRTESGKLATYLHDIQKKRNTLRSLALQGMSAIGRAKPDEAVTTRYSDQETVEVLLFRQIELNQIHQKQKGTWLTFSDNHREFYPHNGRAFGHQKWRELSAKLQMNLVKVASHTAPNSVLQSSLGWLKDYIYLGHPDENTDAKVRVALIRDDDQLCALDGNTQINDKYQLSYNDWLGYQSQKNT
ncbi:MAG: CRISPR-associated helicase Cas3' [Thiomicrorhabdus chilensis]|uniref:CRISPR-associated helicase Cas3' n=1 Tax=Thiomicrorhabdus chilensis TaxID=63656 RepID=UPI00299D6B97|nr:CRISPR-associated helicase Cas3' [Thiomicrorhabdus chilensis]MDX1348092.1 CRISPR-associated helicase Cas3' [Thiomicrorhabdus chilensis]